MKFWENCKKIFRNFKKIEKKILNDSGKIMVYWNYGSVSWFERSTPAVKLSFDTYMSQFP